MIIDAHVHLCPEGILAATYTPETMPAYGMVSDNPYDKYVSFAKEKGIEKALVFPMPLSEMNNGDKDPYVLEAYKKHPDFFIPFVLIDKSPFNLEKYGDNIVGVKAHTLLTHIFSPKDFFQTYDWMSSKNLFLTIHPEKYKEAETVKEISTNFPNLQIILAHSGRNKMMTADGILENALVLKSFPNIYFDTSNIRESEKLKRFINIVGHHRVLFGSDFPFGRKDIYAEELQTIIDMKLSLSIKQDILFNNANQLIVSEWDRKRQNTKTSNNNVMQKLIYDLRERH